jgi:lipopolysaccharide export LptBFGC system permease protein LptF
LLSSRTNAILAILLILALAFALTTFFFDRNLKPQARQGHTRLFLAHRLMDDLILGAAPCYWSQPP